MARGAVEDVADLAHATDRQRFREQVVHRRRSSSFISRHRSVRTTPGATALTRIRCELDGQGARERAQRAADSRRDRPAETFVYLITNGYSSGTIVTVDGGSVLV